LYAHPAGPVPDRRPGQGAARKGSKLNREAIWVQKTLEAPQGKPKFNDMDPPSGGPGPRPLSARTRPKRPAPHKLKEQGRALVFCDP